MEVDWIRVAGTVTCVALVLLALFLVLRFPIFPLTYRAPAETVEPEPAVVGSATSRFLWTYRLPDLMISAGLLFTAATCCVAMLRAGRREEG